MIGGEKMKMEKDVMFYDDLFGRHKRIVDEHELEEEISYETGYYNSNHELDVKSGRNLKDYDF